MQVEYWFMFFSISGFFYKKLFIKYVLMWLSACYVLMIPGHVFSYSLNYPSSDPGTSIPCKESLSAGWCQYLISINYYKCHKLLIIILCLSPHGSVCHRCNVWFHLHVDNSITDSFHLRSWVYAWLPLVICSKTKNILLLPFF